jgi:hypothetical protein
MLERPDIDQAEHARHDQRVAQRRELRELAAERKAETGTDDIGNRDAPYHRIGDIEILGEHVRSGNQTLNEEGAEQNRHAGAAWHAECHGRDKMATFAGIG